jgi:PAS domain S-box-containing protein
MLSDMGAVSPIPPSPDLLSASSGFSVPPGDSHQQSDARFRALAQVTGQIYWVADAQGHLIDPVAWCAFTGQTPEEASGDGWVAAVHPDDVGPTLADWTTAVATGHVYRREHRVRRADGHYRMMLAQAYPVLAADHVISEWVGVDTDITLLQELRADVQASQEEFRATFEQAAVGIAHVRLEDGHLLRVNRKFGDILGTSPEELIGRSFQELTYPADLDTNLALFEQLLAGTISTYTLEKRYLRKDGRLVWAQLTASLKCDQAGQPEYGIAVVEDISARKAAEETVRQVEEELRARVQEWETIFASLNEGLIVLDGDGRVLRCNPAYEALVGWPAGSALYRVSAQERYRLLHIRDVQGQLIPFDQLPTPHVLHGETLVQEQIFRRQDGSDIYVSVRGAPLTDAAGRVIGGVLVLHDTTEQRRLERKAAAAARELETIFASMNDGLIVFGSDGIARRSNPAYAALVGWPADSALYAMLPEERVQALQLRDSQGAPLMQGRAALEQMLRGESVAEEQILRSRDGRDVAVSIRGAPLVDPAGQIEGAVLVVRDITERRQLERQALDLANQLEAMFTAIADGVAIYDRSGRLVRANPAYHALLGVPVNPDHYDLTSEERYRRFQVQDETGRPLSENYRIMEELLHGESAGSQGVDLSIQTLDGRSLEVNVTGGPLRDGAGTVVGAVVVYHDVTERCRLEQQTHQALQALLRMAKLLVQHSPEQETRQEPLAVERYLAELACSLLGCPVAIILTLDPQTLVMEVLGTIGYTAAQEKRLHTIISEWVHTPPDLAHITRLMAGETLVLDVSQPPYQKFAELFEARQAIAAPMQLGGQIIGLVVFNPGSDLQQTFTDQQIALAGATAQLVGLVLERERWWREREEASARTLALQESNRQMDTFLGLVSHELRTPLASMKMSLQLLRRNIEQASVDKPAEAQLKCMASFPPLLETAERQMRRLERLVKELLNAVRIKENKLVLRLELTDIGPLVEEVVAEQRELTPERLIQMSTPLNQALMVRVDSDQIRQAVTNYLTNALKYSPESAPVVVGIEQEAEQVRVWVRDQGAGIPRAEQKHLWERFHRVPGIQEQSGPSGGLGLGLYVTRMLIERHGGQVGMHSAPGEGSTFWFTLPLAHHPFRNASGNG